jgi:hypothetical protein
MPAANGQLPDSDLAPIAGGRLRRDCAAAWNAMNVQARTLGLELRPTGSASSYRTLQQQKALYALYLSGRGALAAKPGTSNHGWGTAVDLATHEMRAMVDRIGAKYGWSKQWSDAQSEWWHILYQAGHYTGPDPGPEGTATPPTPTPIPQPPEGTMALFVATMKDGRFEIFVEKSDGSIWHTWQAQQGGWAGAEAGKKNATWYPLGTPGK